MSGVLRARGLYAAYGPCTVLHDVHCEVGRGWCAIVGPNGAGKSTLLRALAGLLVPAAGRIELDGEPLAALPARERGRRIAWLGQLGETCGDLTVRETVALGRLPHLGPFAAAGVADAAAIDAAMAATECSDWQDRPLAHLSGGERQRTLLARALATEAPVLLLDEPTTHLDPPHQVALARLARRLAHERTVVSVMHDLPLAFAADRVIVMRAGRIAADGRPDDTAVQAAARAAFDDAVRFEQRDGRVAVAHNL
jgi:iron complex transport system ATP-binding protein